MTEILKFLTKYNNKEFKVRDGKKSFNSLDLMKKDDCFLITIDFLNKKYKDGYGLKSLIKEYSLPITYTKLKFLFDLAGIERNHGYSVINDRLKEIRRIKAKNEFMMKKGFFAANIQESIKIKNSIARGIGGYYYNKSKNKYVWLRSSWEYIFAKWLDSKNIIWDVEVKVYKINNNKTYKPDFFIYDLNKLLCSIIEIKGYWKDKIWKFEELKKIITDEIDLIIITDIKPYVEIGSSIKKEITFWKKNRILKL